MSSIKDEVLELYEHKNQENINNILNKLIKYNDINLDDTNVKNDILVKYYLDYNMNSLELAKEQKYLSIYASKKNGITEQHINKILYNKSKFSYLIINFSTVLTKNKINNNLDDEIINMSYDDFVKYYEDTLKWGENIDDKSYLSMEKCKNFSLFKENIILFFKKIHSSNIKIIIISTLNSQIIEGIFKINNIYEYIDKFVTCDMYNITSKKRKEIVKQLLFYTDEYINSKSKK